MRPPPHLVGPVTAASCVVRRVGVLYTECDRRALLIDRGDRTVHELAPGAAAVWARLDGSPLGAAFGDGAGGVDGEVRELVRRLRALGLAEDRRPDVEPPPLPPEVPFTGTLEFEGGEDGPEAAVRFVAGAPDAARPGGPVGLDGLRALVGRLRAPPLDDPGVVDALATLIDHHGPGGRPGR